MLVATLMLCLDGTRDGDLYLQMASGRFVDAHGFVAVDPFRTIAHGEPWLNQQWLSELLVYRVAGWIGVTGLTVVYAVLVAAPLGLLLWLCRRKGLAMTIALAVLYCPGLWLIVHPRAAGFSLLGFSLLAVIVVLAWLPRGSQSPPVTRLRWAVPATLALFGLWANLHGGFVAGLILIGVVACGLVLERGLGLPNAVGPGRIGLLALTAVLAAGVATVATPLGGALWSYLASFDGSAISLASSEWQSAFQSPLAIAYLGAAAAFAAWLWSRAEHPRTLTPALVVLAFLALALVSLRNIVFIGPVSALAVASLAPDKPMRIPMPFLGLVVSLSAAAAATWAVAVGPARNEPLLDSRLVGYALRHPPPSGHIATYGGLGSYMIWRAPRARVELNGWLEHFTPAELRGTYDVLDGRTVDPMPDVRRLRIGAVIADRHVAIRALQAHGFAIEFSDRAGTYLVRRLGAEATGRARESGATLPSSR